MSSSMAINRLLACAAAGFMLMDCAGAHAAPMPKSICALHAGASVTQIDIFDGDPAELVSLAPDDSQSAPNTYTVKDVYAQGRHVTVRCHYGKNWQDVMLTTPVSRCAFSGDDAHPALACK